MEELTEYERRREENVLRNAAMIAALGVQNVVQDLRSTHVTKVEQKGYKLLAADKKRSRTEPIVLRRSLRSKGLSPDNELKQGMYSDDELSSPSSKKNLDLHLANADRPFSNVHVTHPGTDTQFLRRIISLQESLDERPLADIFLSDTCGHSDTGDVKVQVSDPTHLRLERKDIARVVPERIFDVLFLPSKEKLIIAAGDKSGHIGLWDADCDLEEGDGVHIYRPHTSPVSAIASNVYDITKLISCSYDGYARILDMGKSVFNVIHASEKILTALCYSPDSSACVYLGDDEGTMKCLDIRDIKVSSSIGLHNRRINSVQLNPQRSHLMMTGSTDGTACLWDIRHLGKGHLDNLAELKHPRAVQSAYFSPSGNHIGSTSYDDCVRVWSGLFQNALTADDCDALHLDEPAIIPHNNQTNRWLSTFRAIWGWNDSHLFVGNMGRAMDVLSVEEKRVTASLRADIMTSIPCRFACHSLLPGLLAGGTAGGKVYFWR